MRCIPVIIDDLKYSDIVAYDTTNQHQHFIPDIIDDLKDSHIVTYDYKYRHKRFSPVIIHDLEDSHIVTYACNKTIQLLHSSHHWGTYQIQDSHVASPRTRFSHLAVGKNGPCKDACVYEYADQGKHEPLSNKIHTLRGLGWCGSPLTLPVSILPCNLQYLVTPTLKNTR